MHYDWFVTPSLKTYDPHYFCCFYVVKIANSSPVSHVSTFHNNEQGSSAPLINVYNATTLILQHLIYRKNIMQYEMLKESRYCQVHQQINNKISQISYLFYLELRMHLLQYFRTIFPLISKMNRRTLIPSKAFHNCSLSVCVLNKGI